VQYDAYGAVSGRTFAPRSPNIAFSSAFGRANSPGATVVISGSVSGRVANATAGQ